MIIIVECFILSNSLSLSTSLSLSHLSQSLALSLSTSLSFSLSLSFILKKKKKKKKHLREGFLSTPSSLKLHGFNESGVWTHTFTHCIKYQCLFHRCASFPNTLEKASHTYGCTVLVEQCPLAPGRGPMALDPGLHGPGHLGDHLQVPKPFQVLHDLIAPKDFCLYHILWLFYGVIWGTKR